jgi:hypothetical protein
MPNVGVRYPRSLAASGLVLPRSGLGSSPPHFADHSSVEGSS